MTARPPYTGPMRRRLAAAACVLAAGLATAGCAKPLFPKDEPRTQFQAHDQMGSSYTPLEEPDVFGNPQPALRARLLQQ